MSDLTEVEILDCLRTNLRAAIQHCEDLANLPAQGPTYIQFRKELKLIEGSCRQIAHWREDSRWLQLGLIMEEAHQRAGKWIRKHHPRPLFLKLAENLRAMIMACHNLETMKTGKRGPILPEISHNHAEVRKTPSGLIIPPGVNVNHG